MLNAVFLPIIYFLYPETGSFILNPYLYSSHADCAIANRTLEDVDAYYRSNPPLIVVGDPDTTSVRRPVKFIQHEDEEIHRKAKQTQSIPPKDYEPANSEHVD